MAMRSRLLLPMLTLAAMIAVGVIWQRERAVAALLQDRFATLARQELSLAQLRAERERLHRENQKALPHLSTEPITPPLVLPLVGRSAPPDWKVGEWTPATVWRNAGRATPQATTTTLLWAAAKGDVTTVREIFQFGEDTRAKARAWFDSLPPETRSLHATPEDLVAGVTLTQISPGHAQLSWLHQADADQAIVGLLVSRPRTDPASALPVMKAANGNSPPALEDRAHYNVVVLNLQRAPDGWRVHVPADAIDNLTRNLRAPVTK